MGSSSSSKPSVARVYIGNIPYDVTKEEIAEFFAPRTVKEIKIVTDRETGRPRGFGFVTLDSPEVVREAVAALNGLEMGGRSIVVNEAHERESGAPKGRRDDRRDDRRDGRQR